MGALVELSMVACDRCGAGLPVQPGHATVTCAYCRHTAKVEQQGARLTLPARAEDVDAEGLAALEAAFRKLHGVHRGIWLEAVVVGFVATCLAIVIYALVTGEERGSIIGWFSTGCGLLIGLGRVGLQHGMGRRLAKAHRKRARAAHPSPRDQQANCPACGANVVVPTGTACLACLYCRAPLIATDGMLVRWFADAEQRARSWLEQADVVARRAEAEHGRQRWRAFAMLLLTAVPLPLLCAGLISVLAYLGIPSLEGREVRFDGKPTRVREQYGKLVRIRHEGRTLWVTADDTSFDPRMSPAREPDDRARWQVGQTIRCEATGDGEVEVYETHGYMVLVGDDGYSRATWSRDRDCEAVD